ncbi:cyclic di-AMP binding protein CbpA [Fredinandcohnia quinoae]|uniref:Cyclic di-AMP binding protein CbpA n=1 Tax=Fredinandcohnia quinoae TaxID=2918902 RepID=A0AAW5EDN6_9BACI|nr:cyclic di-AMP binding protein CbpA [Fredinandcohnia sp. SECRCQ15]MCH1627566.1 cyclic di-AMP binding protein CbpA [Fredinandcohnia sp. SECRCQ15]
MKIRYNFVPKTEVKYCDENLTVQQAYDFLKETGYRSVPVLAENGTKFVGLIYKVHLLEYLYERQGTEQDKISSLIASNDAFIFEEDSFFKTFLTIRRLPFIAVLNSANEFIGIITHANVMDVLEDSFGMKTGGYTLTVATIEHKGAIKELVSVIQDVNIDGMLTLDNGEKYLRRIILNLPSELSEDKLQRVIDKLEEKEFRVTHVDRIK